MSTPPPITEAEEMILRELWKKSPQTAQDIFDRLASQTQWKLTTVKTLINRLLAKGAISAVQRGKANDYFPAVSEEVWIASQSRTFLDRFFQGALTPMVAHLFEKQRISQADLDALRALLAKSDSAQSSPSQSQTQSGDRQPEAKQ